MERIGVADAKRDLSIVINKVAFTHEPVIVTSRGKPKAVLMGHEEFLRLTNAGPLKTVRLGGLWAGTSYVSPQMLRAARTATWRRSAGR